ncbi:hypothetical protein EV178_005396 [Coemansia sp. RSA 1646]|nr:hypothetical protein EV178_005396 [Coemansia sp. RSA 1646]KAJ1770398.1 hypothetical protein LPJ74_003205 [Coemansia sp. RSA 1843]KAJ2088214.1 hypothetical protein IW138_004386 [Coemansia sp. RSA 986]
MPLPAPLPLDNASSDIECIDITIDIRDVSSPGELNARVAVLFNQIFTPEPAIKALQVSLKKMSGTYTNCVYMVTIDPASTVPISLAFRTLRATAGKNQHGKSKEQHQESTQLPRKYLLHVYGTDIDEILSREKELFWVSQLALLGFGSQIYAIFGNGRIEEFLESTTLTNDDTRHASTSRLIAQRVSELHNMPTVRLKCDGNAQYVKILDNWHKIEQAVQKLKMRIEQEAHSPLVFLHGDLQCGNILRLEHTGKLEIVDVEFSGYSYRGFDIANHFTEWMANYTSEYPHVLDPAQYPTVEQRHAFLRTYVLTKASIDAGMKADSAGCAEELRAIGLSEDQIHKEVAALDREVALFVPAAHLHLAVRGLLKVCCYAEMDFDYVSYTAQRLSIFLDQVDNME